MTTNERQHFQHSNIVLLAAGHGSRFSSAGYVLPKPLLPIKDVPLGCMALLSVLLGERVTRHSLYAVIQEQHCRHHNLDKVITSWFPTLQLVSLRGILPGPVHSGIEVIDILEPNSPIVFVDCDQFFLQPGILKRIFQCFQNGCSVAVGTMFASGPDFGYVVTNSDLRVTHVVENYHLATRALAGVYAFDSVEMFRSLANSEIAESEKCEVRFSDLLHRCITQGLRVSEVPIEHHFACGTPVQYQSCCRLLSLQSSD